MARYVILTDAPEQIRIYDYRVRGEELEFIEAPSRVVRRVPLRTVRTVRLAGPIERLFARGAPGFADRERGSIGRERR